MVPVVSRSETAARAWATPLGLVFIDGGHALETVPIRLPVLGATPGVRRAAAVHDIFTDPAKGGQAPYQVYRTAAASGRFRELPRIGTSGALRAGCEVG